MKPLSTKRFKPVMSSLEGGRNEGLCFGGAEGTYPRLEECAQIQYKLSAA